MVIFQENIGKIIRKTSYKHEFLSDIITEWNPKYLTKLNEIIKKVDNGFK